jgi:hypothetical protein
MTGYATYSFCILRRLRASSGTVQPFRNKRADRFERDPEFFPLLFMSLRI